MSDPRIEPPTEGPGHVSSSAPVYAPPVVDPVHAPPGSPPAIIEPSPVEATAVRISTRRHAAVVKALDGVLSVQRPIVLAHLRRMLARHPEATPAELIRRLERHYLATVTTGGAGVGMAAAIPAVGTATALAISTAETVGFLEATALFAHSVAEVHGIVLADRQRTHALVLALMLGEEGAALLRRVTGQVSSVASGAGAAVAAERSAFWADTITSSLPRSATGPLLDQLRRAFMKKLAKTGTASVIGKAMPYGIGAAIGGTGNHLLGRRVVGSSHRAFGPPPLQLPAELVTPQVRNREPQHSLVAKRRSLGRTRR